jgi:hypothetical protein
MSEKAAIEGVELRFKNAQKKLDEKCNEFNAVIDKEKRDAGDSAGTHGSTGRGPDRKPRKKRKVHEHRCRALQISLVPLGEDKSFCDVISGGLVRLNTDHRTVVAYVEADQLAPLYQAGMDMHSFWTAANLEAGPLFEALGAARFKWFVDHHTEQMKRVDVGDLLRKAKTKTKEK